MTSTIIKNEIYSLYKKGITRTKITEITKISFSTVTKTLKEFGIISKRNVDLTLNHNYFEKIDTDKKAYFLGLILADGNILKNQNRIQLSLISNDDYVLEEFKKDINSSNKIRRYKIFDKRTKLFYNRTTFSFSSKKVKNDLYKIGITHDKSLNFKNIKISNDLFFSFMRGLIDGDGHIAKDKICLLSTKEFLDFLNEKYLNNSGWFVPIQIEKNVWEMRITTHKTMISLLGECYKHSEIHLKRKYEKYILLKNKVINLIEKRKNHFVNEN